MYVNGQVLGAEPFTSAGTPVLTNSTHDLDVGRNGSASEWFTGSVDELALYTRVVADAEVAAQYGAGRAVATGDTTVIRDAAGRPVETAAAFVANPGFEQWSTGWTLGTGASISTTSPATGVASLSTGTVATTQIAQLVPGQAFRLQFATKAAASTSVTVKLQYANLAGTWTVLGSINTDIERAGRPRRLGVRG